MTSVWDKYWALEAQKTTAFIDIQRIYELWFKSIKTKFIRAINARCHNKIWLAFFDIKKKGGKRKEKHATPTHKKNIKLVHCLFEWIINI